MIDPSTIKVGDRYAVEWGEGARFRPYAGRTFVATVIEVNRFLRVVWFETPEGYGSTLFEETEAGTVKLARIENQVEVVAP